MIGAYTFGEVTVAIRRRSSSASRVGRLTNFSGRCLWERRRRYWRKRFRELKKRMTILSRRGAGGYGPGWCRSLTPTSAAGSALLPLLDTTRDGTMTIARPDARLLPYCNRRSDRTEKSRIGVPRGCRQARGIGRAGCSYRPRLSENKLRGCGRDPSLGVVALQFVPQ